MKDLAFEGLKFISHIFSHFSFWRSWPSICELRARYIAVSSVKSLTLDLTIEYGSSVWDPQSILLQDELEKVQKRAARFVTGNYIDYETGSMTGILKNLKWESLKKRRKDSRLIMLYKGLKGAASIPTNDLVPPIRRTRNHHSLAFQIPMAGTDIYKSSFFPQTIRDWNLVTDSLITASECAVDSVTKFTSLVRARD